MEGDVCKVDGCEKVIISRYGRACGSCRSKKRRYGEYTNKFQPKSIEDRFWPNVNKTESCWLWAGFIESGGYGRVRVADKPVGAHRVSWELNIGKIPDGMWVLHKCDVRHCVNPDHLFIGTPSDNVQDMIKKGRQVTSSLKGEQAPSSKLTEQHVIEIKFLLENGHSIASIARKFHVSPTPVYKIKHNQTWRHLNDN